MCSGVCRKGEFLKCEDGKIVYVEVSVNIAKNYMYYHCFSTSV